MDSMRIILDIFGVLFIMFMVWCIWDDHRRKKDVEKGKLEQFKINNERYK